MTSLRARVHHRVVVARAQRRLLLLWRLAQEELFILDNLVWAVPLRQAFSVQVAILPLIWARS